MNYSGALSALTSPLAGTGDDYQIAFQTGQSSTVTVVNGSQAMYLMQVNPDNLFGGNVSFVCPANMPAETTCSITPANPVPVTPSTPAMFTAVFQTTSRTPTSPKNGGAQLAASLPLQGSFPLLGALVFLCVLVLVLASSGTHLPRRGWIRSILVPIALTSIGIIVAGCHHHGTTTVTGTPAGTTIMSLQGNAQNASRGITITLIVQ